MNADSAFEILQEANPVPDPVRYRQITTAGHAFLAATKERTLHMETITPAPEKQGPPTRRRGLAIAVTVFVVVLVGVALALGPLRGPDVVDPAPPTTVTTVAPPTTVAAIPAPPFSTPAEAAKAYLDVRFNGNYQQLESLMGVDGTDSSLDVDMIFDAPPNAERMEMRFDFQQATQGSFTDLECVESANLTARCTYSAEDLRLPTLGVDGTVKYTQSFRIDEEGRLLSVGRQEPDFTQEHRAAARGFLEWMDERYPELIAEDDAVWGAGEVTRPIEEIVADWNAARDEYMAENG